MPRVFILATVALLAFAPLGGHSVAARQSAQTPPAESADGEWAWDGVSIEGPLAGEENERARAPLSEFLGIQGSQQGGGRDFGAQLDTFRVPFQNRDGLEKAFIPEVIGAEFMVVIVETGEFVLDVKGPGSYVVDPVADSGEPADIEIMIGEISDDRLRIYYEPTGHVILDERGEPCHTLCTVLPGFAVHVTEGDRIIAPAGAICVWCLLNGNRVEAQVEEGVLTVFPRLRNGQEFSWAQEDRRAAEVAARAQPRSTPTASATAPLMRAWAFFSPGPGCHRGPG